MRARIDEGEKEPKEEAKRIELDARARTMLSDSNYAQVKEMSPCGDSNRTRSAMRLISALLEELLGPRDVPEGQTAARPLFVCVCGHNVVEW